MNRPVPKMKSSRSGTGSQIQPVVNIRAEMCNIGFAGHHTSLLRCIRAFGTTIFYSALHIIPSGTEAGSNVIFIKHEGIVTNSKIVFDTCGTARTILIRELLTPFLCERLALFGCCCVLGSKLGCSKCRKGHRSKTQCSCHQGSG